MRLGITVPRTLRALFAVALIVSAASILVVPHHHSGGAGLLDDSCPACQVSRGHALPASVSASPLSVPPLPRAANWSSVSTDPTPSPDADPAASPRAPPSTLPA
jgi:hypothetical protein